jgi:prepilin-type N-terminal cleavage/methylation domain-containing protein
MKGPLPTFRVHPPRGFTLVELLVTIFACGVVLGGLSIAVDSQSAVAQRHRDMVIANAYANSKVEALRSKGFLGLTDGTTNLTSELPAELKSPRSASLVVSSHTVSVKQVDLTITYNERGVARTYSYTTLIGELGVGQY